MEKISNFNNFINEATLRGNPGFPGEDPSKSPKNFIDAILSLNKEEAQNFVRQNPGDLNIMSNVGKAMGLQRGHEKELSNLAEEAIRYVYGTFIDDIILDLKITNTPQQDLMDKMEECPSCKKNIEELEDQEIIDEINKRKIIRTVQQGKGLNVKEIINLPMVAQRINEILGEEKGNEYRKLLNKIAAGAHYYDMTLTPEQKSSMFKMAPPGACDIQIKTKKEEEEEEKKDDQWIEDLLKNIQNDGEINPEAIEELNPESTVIARAMDFGLLIHESVKGIYKLITQTLLLELSDRLGLEASEIVISNTETLFDEIEEQAIGKKLQMILGIVINTNEGVKDKIDNIIKYADPDDAQNYIASFLEQLHWLFYGKLSQITPAKKCLELFHSILEQTIDPQTKKLKTEDQIASGMDRSMVDPIIYECLNDMEKEKEYQEYKSRQSNGDDSLGFDDIIY